jgi:hypothetical protein
MQWLLYGNLPTGLAEDLVLRGHKTHLPADLTLTADATLPDIVNAAAAAQWDILTADPALPALLFGPPEELPRMFGRSVVLIQPQAGEAPHDILERLFKRYPRLTPWRLYTVTPSRVKIRQLPRRRNVRASS